jgi:hypothetical protein
MDHVDCLPRSRDLDLSHWVGRGRAPLAGVCPTTLPTTAEDIGLWVEEVGFKLEARWPRATNVGQESRVLDVSGELRIKRHFVPSDWLEIRSKGEKREITYQLALPEGPERTGVQAGTLQIAPAWLLRTSRCSKCHGSYEDCPCSKVLDEQVQQVVTKADLLGAVWTDRTALSGV